MRAAPLVLAVLVIGALLGTTVLWIISAVALAGVAVLVFLSVRDDKFVGPRVIIDDVHDKLKDFGKDRSADNIDGKDIANDE